MKKLISEETNEQVQEFDAQVSLIKESSKKKEKIFATEDIFLFCMSLGFGAIFLLLIWIFGVSIPTGWTFYP